MEKLQELALQMSYRAQTAIEPDQGQAPEEQEALQNEN
jgi:hypothetical protein